tara:strand:- start:19 stop:534 length:516 start_codon:yes stop_codon:yes gene_type:complete
MVEDNMILKINEKWKDQKVDLQQVYFFPKFFSVENSIDFNRLTSIMDVNENKVIYPSKNSNSFKLLKLQDTTSDLFKIQETVKGLFTHNFNMDTAIFASLNKNGISVTHWDEVSVFLIPTYGAVNYVLYEGEKFSKNFQLEVGDLLFIPKNISHSAIPLCPRIVLSVGVYN